MSEISHNPTAPPRPWWKLGLTGWVLIAGLVLLNIGVVVETVTWNKRTVSWLLYRVDPRYWQLWLIPILWGIVCWQATDLACRFDFIRQNRHWIRLIIVLGVCCGVALFCGITQSVVRRQIYYGIYMTYIVGPTSNYMVTGVWDWKILIAPAMAVVAIACLLYIAIKYRKPKS